MCLGSLERTPAAEVLPGTAMTWHESLTFGRVWDEHRDTPRIRAGFVTLARTCRVWPLPAQLIDAMPSHDPQAALPRPSSIPVTREGRMRRLQHLLGELYNPQAAQREERP